MHRGAQLAPGGGQLNEADVRGRERLSEAGGGGVDLVTLDEREQQVGGADLGAVALGDRNPSGNGDHRRRVGTERRTKARRFPRLRIRDSEPAGVEHGAQRRDANVEEKEQIGRRRCRAACVGRIAGPHVEYRDPEVVCIHKRCAKVGGDRPGPLEYSLRLRAERSGAVGMLLLGHADSSLLRWGRAPMVIAVGNPSRRPRRSSGHSSATVCVPGHGIGANH